MRATLNISLDGNVCPNATAERRYAIVRAALRLCFAGVVGEIQSVSYDGPDGRVHEHCGVFEVECDASQGVFEDALRGISQSLGQDCIAVLYQDGSGKCIGPRAERWPFDLKRFNRPAVQLAAEAA
jgi:hypothetical protein